MNRMRDSLGDGYPSPNGVKRSRMDDSFENFSRLSGPVDFRSSGMGNDSNNPPSSRVLAVKNLGDSVMEADLVDALSHFGSVSYVQLIGRGSGLVEFEELQSAERVVSYNLTTDIMVLNQPAMFTFSNLQIIPRQGYESERPSHVLVIYVQNAKYPITTDVINAICKPVSRVLRIMIMRDNGIQCLVEFNDIESARLVKQRLNGCDIYSGCCTLKIEYSKLTRLHVTKNDSDTSDYVTPPSALNPQPTFSALPKDRPALLSEPPVFTGPSSGFRQGQGQGQGRSSSGFPGDERRFDDFPRPDLDEPPRFPGAAFDRFASDAPIGRGGRFDDFNEFSERGSGSGGHFGGGGGGRPPLDGPFGGGGGGGLPLDGPFSSGGGGRNMGQSIFQDIEPPRFSSGNSGPPRYNDMPMGFPSGGGGGGGDMRHKHDGCGMGDDDAVLMIYGLNPEKINCDRLFNLFCQYGNVVRIKFLKSKNDTVMIQMGDPVAAQRAIDHLKNALVFGGRMSVNLSRQNRLNEVREPAELPDKTSSYKDFTNNRNNRFLSPEIAAKNRINPPQKYLYFFNAPPQVNEEELREIFQTHDAPKPVSIKIFEKKGNFAKNSAGIIEFENEDESIEAIMLCNHLPIDSKTSKTPFVWKLCFAGPPSSNVMGEGGDGGGGFSRPPNMPNNYNGPAFARGGGRGGSGGGRGGSVGGRGGSGGSRGGDDRGRGRSPPRGSGGPPRGGGGMQRGGGPQRGGGSSGGAPRFGGGPGGGSGPYYAGSGADRGRGGSGGGRGRGRSY